MPLRKFTDQAGAELPAKDSARPSRGKALKAVAQSTLLAAGLAAARLTVEADLGAADEKYFTRTRGPAAGADHAV